MWRDILFLSSISLSNLTIKHLCTLVTKSYLNFLINLKTNYPFPVCSRGQEVDIQTNLMTQNYILNDSQYLLGHAANNPTTTGVWFDIPHFGDALNLYSITSRMGVEVVQPLVRDDSPVSQLKDDIRKEGGGRRRGKLPDISQSVGLRVCWCQGCYEVMVRSQTSLWLTSQTSSDLTCVRGRHWKAGPVCWLKSCLQEYLLMPS